MNHRVEGTGPAPPLYVDIVLRIAARRQRPDDVVDARRVDIVVDDDGEAILIAAGKTLRSNDARLLHVAGVTLLDGDYGKLSWAGLVRPNASDLGHAGFLQLFPDMSRARNCTKQRQRMRRPGWIRARNDRIVSIEYSFHADEGFEAFWTRVVAWPLAERTFFFQLTRPDFSLENYFRVSGIRETSEVAANHFSGLSSKAAGEIELTDSRRHRAGGGEPVERIAAKHDVDRHRSVLLEVFLFVNEGVLSRTDVNPSRVLVLRHDPVGADIDPTGIGIFGDDQVSSAEVAAAVFFVQQRRGKFPEIHLVVFLNILMDGPTFHFRHRNRHAVLDFLMVHPGEFQDVVELFVDAED